MPMTDHWRRPTSGSLRGLYDEGVAAASVGGNCPYLNGPRGNPTREHIWRQGYEDESERLAIAALV